jgi:hypothetical protein
VTKRGESIGDLHRVPFQRFLMEKGRLTTTTKRRRRRRRGECDQEMSGSNYNLESLNRTETRRVRGREGSRERGKQRH